MSEGIEINLVVFKDPEDHENDAVEGDIEDDSNQKVKRVRGSLADAERFSFLLALSINYLNSQTGSLTTEELASNFKLYMHMYADSARKDYPMVFTEDSQIPILFKMINELAGDALLRRGRDLKSEILNNMNPLWNDNWQKDHSGWTLADAIEDTKKKLHDQDQKDKLEKAKRSRRKTPFVMKPYSKETFHHPVWIAFELLGKPAGIKCMPTFMSKKWSGPETIKDAEATRAAVLAAGSRASRDAVKALARGNVPVTQNDDEGAILIDLQEESNVQSKNLNLQMEYDGDVSRLEKRISLAESLHMPEEQIRALKMELFDLLGKKPEKIVYVRNVKRQKVNETPNVLINRLDYSTESTETPTAGVSVLSVE